MHVKTSAAHFYITKLKLHFSRLRKPAVKAGSHPLQPFPDARETLPCVNLRFREEAMRRFWLGCLDDDHLVRGCRSVHPQQLRCEYRANPQGIDVLRAASELWILEPANPKARGLYQTAYRVLVSSSGQALRGQRNGDLWDSGKGAIRPVRSTWSTAAARSPPAGRRSGRFRFGTRTARPAIGANPLNGAWGF